MDYQVSPRTIADRLYARRVIARIERNRMGMTTANYQRSRQRQSVVFLVLMMLSLSGGVALLFV